MNSAAPILRKALTYGSLLTVAIALVGAVVGYLVAGGEGVVSALVGAAMTAVFMGLTAASMLVAGRIPGPDPLGTRFFGIVLAVWFVKLVLFVLVALALRGQPWLNAYVFFGVVVASVVGSLITDAVALQRARVPYVGDVALPGTPAGAGAPPDRAGRP